MSADQIQQVCSGDQLWRTCMATARVKIISKYQEDVVLIEAKEDEQRRR